MINSTLATLGKNLMTVCATWMKSSGWMEEGDVLVFDVTFDGQM